MQLIRKFCRKIIPPTVDVRRGASMVTCSATVALHLADFAFIATRQNCILNKEEQLEEKRAKASNMLNFARHGQFRTNLFPPAAAAAAAAQHGQKVDGRIPCLGVFDAALEYAPSSRKEGSLTLRTTEEGPPLPPQLFGGYEVRLIHWVRIQLAASAVGGNVCCRSRLA